MRFHIVACEVLFREVAFYAATADHVVDVTFVRKGLHDDPDLLRETLQKHIDSAEQVGLAEAIVLGYGLCSNGTAGLWTRKVPLVVPRAHDCITLFLGSRHRYVEVFSDRPGTYYYTSGWLERGSDAVVEAQRSTTAVAGQSFEELVARYGEDNARYLMEFQDSWRQRYTTVCYIRMPLSHKQQYCESVRKTAEENGWEYLELEGDDRLIRAMARGEWNEEDFLVLQPGQRIRPSYDETVICAGCSGGCA
ncbi:MAG: DUF1638 domain-containing protein [Armatimonadetes bacterium]|nr:DUF1638 domain-containing protein [Armatimonadota bacterium]